MRKGLPLRKLPKREELRRRGKIDSPTPSVGRTILLTISIGKRISIDIWHNNRTPNNPLS
jgi:hypothetical protein